VFSETGVRNETRALKGAASGCNVANRVSQIATIGKNLLNFAPLQLKIRSKRAKNLQKFV